MKSVRDVSKALGQDVLALTQIMQEEHKSYARSMKALAEGLSQNARRHHRLQKETWEPWGRASTPQENAEKAYQQQQDYFSSRAKAAYEEGFQEAVHQYAMEGYPPAQRPTDFFDIKKGLKYSSPNLFKF